MTCRQVMDNESENFDYFIFTENDQLWLEHHIRNFIRYEDILPENRITGLIQYEDYDDEEYKYYPSYHDAYDLDFTPVEEYDNLKFAHFSNVHQGSFLISRQQHRRIKANHNFAQFLSNDRYSMKCKATTDIYLNSGLKKLICVSEFDQNLIHHLPNIYITGKLGLDKLGSDNARMTEALKRLLQ